MSTRGKKDNMDDCPKLDVKSAENILRNVFNECGILPPENLSRFFRTSEEAIDKKTERGMSNAEESIKSDRKLESEAATSVV